ncbi:MAG: hypothetical protein ACRC2R_23525 [Xenococcaceae cyanobacterium]
MTTASQSTQQQFPSKANKQHVDHVLLICLLFLVIIYMLSALFYKKYCQQQKMIRLQEIKKLERMMTLPHK